ncbi:MAG: AAA family ATPase [Candidatus Omnitrophota bacterium]
MFSEPVVGKYFFGRNDLLQLLDKRVETLKDGYRQNVAITGQSMTGKSSLLQHFLYTIRDDSFIPIYVELGKESFQSFASKFIATLLYNSLRSQGDKTTGTIDSLLERAQNIIPRTADAIRHILEQIEKKQMSDAYFGLLGLTSSLREETSKSCIVILDEFHNIESFDIKNPFSIFGKVIMLQKDTMYIVTSSRMNTIKKILQEKLALLFGNFEVVELKGFRYSVASDYIERRIKPLAIDPATKRFLISFTDGNPFYLNYLCGEAKNIAQALSRSMIDQSDVEEATLSLVYGSNGTIHQYLLNFLLNNLDGGNRDTHLTVLVSLAKGCNKLKEITRDLKKNSSDVSRILEELIEIGIISKRGAFYIIDDSVLRFWLYHVYHAKQTMLINYVLERASAYRSDLKAYISDYSQDANKGIFSKVVELFDLFANDYVQHGDKTILLPQFTRVGVGTYDDITPHIVATAKNKCWVCRIYTSIINEDDIADCLRNMKSSPQKIAKYVAVPLAGIDENAKLLAKELKIALWDLEFINMLLHVYGKNGVILY